MKSKEYERMKLEFKRFFNQDLTEDEIGHQEGGIIGDEAMPLGRYVWDKSHDFIEYYVSWLPHYRGDSHGIIYKDGTHQELAVLPHIGEVSPAECALRKELEEKGLLDL